MNNDNGLIGTLFGTLELVHIGDFITYHVPRTKLPGSAIKAIVPKLSSGYATFSDNLYAHRNDQFETEEIILTDIILNSNSMNETIVDDFKSYIVKKPLFKNVDELDLKTMQELVDELHRQNIYKMYGFHFSLNKYQHFFVATEADNFRIYYSNTHYKFLPLDNDNKWFIIMYKDGTKYKKELKEYNLYVKY